jgi:tryptophan synthase beta chain
MKSDTNRYKPIKGFYGVYGGAYIPEMLYPNIEELSSKYEDIIFDANFQTIYQNLLKNYVGRPTPLYFSEKLSDRYKSQIFLKREDLNHTGSHKINNAIGQVLLAKFLGKTRIIAETGAGQHGVATATACALLDLECIVYMGSIDIERQLPNVHRMQMLGAKVVAVESGSKTLKDATNEAIRDWITNPLDTHYVIGSVVGPHPFPDIVALFQSVISEEIITQLEQQTGHSEPTHVVACIGGGSNAAGCFYHFINKPQVKLIGVEASGLGIDSGKTAASLIKGTKGVLHGFLTRILQTTDGQIIEPHSISAGLDYPGIGPIHAHLFETQRGIYLHALDKEAINAGIELAKTEGILPALETAHALAVLNKLELAQNDIVVVNLSGRGDKDLFTYLKYLKNE